MRWFEVIHLRITERETENLLPVVRQLVDEARKEGSCQEITMYRRVLVDTDLSILLFHETPKVEKEGSSLGLRIAAALREYGMVKHMTWLEVYSV